MTLINIAIKILNKILANWIQNSVKKNPTSWPSGIYPRYAKLIQHSKINNVTYHIKTEKEKSHDRIRIDAEKCLAKSKTHLWQTPAPTKFCILCKRSQFDNDYKKWTANIILNGEKFRASPLNSGTTQVCFLSSLFFLIILEVHVNQ